MLEKKRKQTGGGSPVNILSSLQQKTADLIREILITGEPEVEETGRVSMNEQSMPAATEALPIEDIIEFTYVTENEPWVENNQLNISQETSTFIREANTIIETQSRPKDDLNSTGQKTSTPTSTTKCNMQNKRKHRMQHDEENFKELVIAENKKVKALERLVDVLESTNKTNQELLQLQKEHMRLYPESHGIVQNYMYDVERDDLFLMALHSNASHPHWWNDAEPLWVTAEKRNLKSAVYWWDGCQVLIKGKKSSKCEEYANYWVWGKVNRDTLNAFTEILDKFQKEDYRLGLIYYEAVDANGHLRGPDSEDRIRSLHDIDSILNDVQDQVAQRGMENQVNLIVVSDHGMTAIEPETTVVIDLEKVINLKDIKLMLDRGAVSMILPEKGKKDKLYHALKKADIKGLNIYRKEDIPDHYHIKHHKLVQPILLVADQGYVIKALSDPKRMKPFSERIFKGYHGYDPYKVKDMRTIFYARGPSFKKGYTSPPLEMVDVYEVIARSMGMESLPNNGSWHRVRNMLTGNALRPETHIGIDKTSKVTLLTKKSKAYKKNKVNFIGKRKNSAVSSTIFYSNMSANFATILACFSSWLIHRTLDILLYRNIGLI